MEQNQIERKIALETFSDYLSTIIITVVACIPIAIYLIKENRKLKNFNFQEITSILISAANEFKTLEQLRKDNYPLFERDMIELLYQRIQEIGSIENEIKAVLSRGVIRHMMKPYLPKIFKKIKKGL